MKIEKFKVKSDPKGEIRGWRQRYTHYDHKQISVKDIEGADALPCTLDLDSTGSIYQINGIQIELDDFGSGHDVGSGCGEYCCSNYEFKCNRATQKILDKYKISLDEYNELAEHLENELSVGECHWCA